jgi:hypothetical protein
LPESQREELEPLLGVADGLALVGNALPASSFADDLEARLLARAGYRPIGSSRVLNEEDNARSIVDAPTVSLLAVPDRLDRSRRRPTSVLPRVSWRVWSSLAAIILLTLTVTTFAIAANASPGSALYSVRRWQEDARTNLTNSDVERTQLHIQYATDALDALDSAVAQHDASAYNEALGRFNDELRQASDALAQVPAGTDHDTLSADLDTLRARGQSDLRAALPSLGWPSRIVTTSALGALGEQVVIVTQVGGVRTISQYGRIWTLTLIGSGFQSGAVLLVRQRPAGHVLSVTPTRLVAQLPAGIEDSLPHDIGVGNPDDTAATTAQVTGEHDDGPGATGTPGGNHGAGGCESEPNDDNPPCTPTPSH